MTTDMTFRRISIKEYDGSYLFFTIISYTLILLIADGKISYKKKIRIHHNCNKMN